MKRDRGNVDAIMDRVDPVELRTRVHLLLRVTAGDEVCRAMLPQLLDKGLLAPRAEEIMDRGEDGRTVILRAFQGKG